MRIYAVILFVVLVVCSGCGASSSSVAKNPYWDLAVPPGDESLVELPSKKSKLTEEELHAWPHADLETDTIPGMSLDKAYEFLSNKKYIKVRVGVIDSGIDIEHEDLNGNVWTNPGDDTADGQDNDGNGYTDDLHGWNFLGGEQGEAVFARGALARQVSLEAKRFQNVDTTMLSATEMEDYKAFLAMKEELNAERAKATKGFQDFQGVLPRIQAMDAEIRKQLNKEVYTAEDLSSLPDGPGKAMMANVLTEGMSNKEILNSLDQVLTMYETQSTKTYNPDFSGRKSGDDPYNIDDVPYGNGFVIGNRELESHGTHVSGIIMADRTNGKGMNGVTNHVQLITARTVPRGDEFDKDVALAIRYMADNGAKVVNMSFGKTISAKSQWVYDAIKYAAEKDVLLVKAAGNDGTDVDTKQYYPTDAPDGISEISDNVISVGATAPYYNEKLVGDFSNYGKLNVDIFAPGQDIYSTIPGNAYGMKQGTSMASPQVAGVAALIRSYYPQLSASQVKHILMNSGTKVGFDVLVPHSKGKERKPFSEFSRSGRILNAYRAVKMADAMVNSIQ